MEQKHSSNVYYFMASLLFVMAWWLAPKDVNTDWGWSVVSGIAAFSGFIMGIQGIQASVRAPSPFPSVTGRILWALRPRAWMIAWAVIIVTVMTMGTPHVLYRYSLGSGGWCEYVGYSGVKYMAPNGNGCPAIRMIL